MPYRSALATLALLLAVCPSGAQAANGGKFMAYGAGTSSCGKFVADFDGSQSSQTSMVERVKALEWVEGYLTYLDKFDKGVADILASTDVNGMELWVYNYCRSHPLENMTQAADALIAGLWPTRATAAPQR
jgi:hypothetical protein